MWIFAHTERTAQLIVQVAGRAGRGEHKGDVYLQSVRPDHPFSPPWSRETTASLPNKL